MSGSAACAAGNQIAGWSAAIKRDTVTRAVRRTVINMELVY